MNQQNEHTNKLAGEKSPYLLQHQHNPVDWLPWGEEAFALARAENKPIFLSIGYSTCHWCHVMERESFENEAVAALMNRYFVNVKVDREERPDVDHVHMTFVQATTGSGGWPMSVFLTPDLKPFYGGTYFPPDDRYGRPGFSSLLKHIAAAWQDDRAKVEASGENVVHALQQYAEAGPPAHQVDWKAVCEKAFKQIAGSYDSRFGGFGEAPKFPRPVLHDFLHRYYAATGSEVALHVSLHTLRAMSKGGVNDHLGGGFHRYSVDEQFIVSHFEKMLYDQAQLAIAYIEAYQLTGDAGFAATARATLDYVLRDMKHEGGGFFAAEDADSYESEGSAHKEEGAFYVWTKSAIAAALDEGDAEIFFEVYGVREAGNAPAGGDPHGEFKGKNILFLARDPAAVAESMGIAASAIEEALRRGRATLLALRSTRPRPHRDEKIIVSWNGQMMAALARAAAAFDEPRYLEAAIEAAGFIRAELYSETDGLLCRHWQNGPASVGGFADDYANLGRGLIDIFEATGDLQWLRWAERLGDTAQALFGDAEAGGLFNSAPDPHVLLRVKEDYDGAEPAASSISAMNDLRLAALLQRDDVGARAEATLLAFAARAELIPQAMPELLCAALFAAESPMHVVIVGARGSKDGHALWRAAVDGFVPQRLIVRQDAAAEPNRRLPLAAAMAAMDGRATAYLCRDFACLEPTTDPAILRSSMKIRG